MRTIIAGSRVLTDLKLVDTAMASCGWVPTLVVSGGAKGIDKLGEIWAMIRGIPVQQYVVTPQEWNTVGPSAGPLRNIKMAQNAEACVAIWDGKSPGTSHMVHTAYNLKLRLFLLNVDTGELTDKPNVPSRYRRRY